MKMKYQGRMMLLAGSLLVASSCNQNGTEALLGSVTGQVLDANQQGVAGAIFIMTRPGRTQKNSQSNSQGEFAIRNAETGTWELEVTAPSGYQLAPGQLNPVPVIVRSGRETEITINVRPTGGGGGGGGGGTVTTN